MLAAAPVRRPILLDGGATIVERDLSEHRKTGWATQRARRLPFDLRPIRLSALIVSLSALLLMTPSAAAGFGVGSFTVTARNEDGTIDQIAASHPFALGVHLSMELDSSGDPDGVLRTVSMDLPSGLLVTAPGLPRCSFVDFEEQFFGCGPTYQVGIARVVVAGLGKITAPVYSVQAPRGLQPFSD